MGYSWIKDPNFRYCFDALQLKPEFDAWELPGCHLTGGSSGGPGLPANGGKIYSLVSYGYGPDVAGMGGPKLAFSSLSCLFEQAKVATGNVVLNYAGTPCPITTPTRAPTKRPTRAPTKRPTRAPTKRPTRAPTRAPVLPPVRPTCSNYKSKTRCTAVAGCRWSSNRCRNV